MRVTQWTWHRSLAQRGVVALAVGIIAITAPYTAGSASAQSASAVPSVGEASRARSVAVVPFTNLSADPADDWIGFGIAETVTADLEQFDLSIIGHEAFLGLGRTSTLASGDESTARELAGDLGVSWIVAGGFQRLGETLRITARLVNVETGATSQSVKIDGALDDVFALQDRIVSGLAEDLQRIARGGPLGVPTSRASNARSVPVEAPVRDQPDERSVRRSASPSAAPSEPAGVASDDVTGGIVIGDDAPWLGVAAEAGALTGRPSIRPARARRAPAIDGRLDDAVWRDAARITDFVQRQPLDGAPATEATEVYIAYDSSNIYLGFYAHYANPAIMRANRSDRDEAFRDDIFSVYFDTFLDQQRAYAFSVNGFGVQGDSIVNSRGGGGFGGGPPGGFSGVPRGDRSWDALFETAGQLVEDGFTAEMVIPFKSLRYPQQAGDAPHRWGFQIARTIGGKDETVVWSPISRSVAGFLPQMGLLDGLTGLSTSRNVEILPTFTAVQFGSLDTSTGDFVNKDPSPEGGVNFKYGVTSNLIADFTFNPDFSQIESDRPQIEVNQRFALFFPELRPFFLEGAEIFSIGGPVTMVHTRTIIDPWYGAKLTGKVGSTTIGVMYANDEAAGAIDDPLDPTFEGSAQTFVGRVRYDLYSESHIGAIFTDREFLDSYSRAGGLDSNFRLGDTHSLTVRALGTQHRDLDGIDTTGHLIDASLRKRGRNLSYGITSYALSPDFKTDVGFVRRTDERRGFGNISYRWWPESWLINWGPRVSYSRSYQFDGILQDERAQVGVNFAFAKSINLAASVNRDMERFGGINFYKTRYSFGGPVNTSRRIGFGAFFNRGDQIFFDPANPYLGHQTRLNGFISLRPIPRLQSQININTSHFTDPRNGGQEVFDVKIFRALTTYQFTDRLLLRNISEYNSSDKTLGLNFLFTYRVNAGTVFYVGYDDRYRQGDRIDGELDGDGMAERLFQSTDLQRTNKAIFMKFQYLFRY